MTVTPLFGRPHIVASGPSPAERVMRSHQIVSEAAVELYDGHPGSGVKAVVFAAATNLALTIGQEEAGAFFDMIAGIARDTQPVPLDPEPAA